MDDLRNYIKTEIQTTLGQQSLNLEADTRLMDLPGWDSIRMLSLLVSIEKKRKVTFQAREVANLKTYGDLIGLVISKCSP